jgi:hypothetical protein
MEGVEKASGSSGSVIESVIAEHNPSRGFRIKTAMIMTTYIEFADSVTKLRIIQAFYQIGASEVFCLGLYLILYEPVP